MRNVRLILVLAVVYLDMLGVGLVYPILPKLVQQFERGDVSHASYLYGLLVSIFSLSQFLFAPLFGALSDRFGRRPVVLASLIGSSLSYFLMAFAPSLLWLGIARLLAGVMGGSFTTAGAYLADITPPEKRAESFGLIGAVFGFGFITGPVLGGLLGSIHLQLPFLVAAILCLANLAFSFVALPESLPPENRKTFDLAQANPLGAVRAIGRYPAICGLLALFVIATFANRVAEMTWVLYTGYRYHWSTWEISLSLAMVGVVFVIGQGGFTRIVIPRIGERRAIVLGLAVSTGVSIAYGFASEGWMVYAIMPFALVGWTIAQPAVQGLMSRAVAANEQGLLQGATASITNLTSIGGPVIWSSLFGYFVSDKAPVVVPGAAFFVSAVLFLVAFLMAVRWRSATLQQLAVA